MLENGAVNKVPNTKYTKHTKDADDFIKEQGGWKMLECTKNTGLDVRHIQRHRNM